MNFMSSLKQNNGISNQDESSDNSVSSNGASPFIQSPNNISPTQSSIKNVFKSFMPTPPPVGAINDFTPKQPPQDIKLGGTLSPFDVFTGPDYTAGGMVRNTILGLPKAALDLAKFEVTPRQTPVPVRRMFETTPIETKAPPIVTQLGNLGFRTAEIIPRAAATVYGEFFAPDRKTGEVNIGINAKRLGYDEPKYQTSTKEVATRINNGENPVAVALDVGSNKTLDLAFGAEMVSGLLKMATIQLESWLKSDMGGARVYAKNMLDAIGDNQKTIFDRTKDLPIEQREKILAPISEAKTQAQQVLKEQGQPTTFDRLRVNISKYTDLLGRQTSVGDVKSFPSRIMRPDVSLKSNPTIPIPLESRPQFQLPGYRDTPGQAPAFGLSTKKVEPVGFGNEGNVNPEEGKLPMSPVTNEPEEQAIINNKIPKPPTPPTNASGNKFFIDEPFNVGLKSNDKLTADSLRHEYSGIKNAQILRGNQLADAIKKLVPNETERQGMFWYKAANGDMKVLQNALNDPKYAEYKAGLQSAMNLPDNAKQALKVTEQYYKEAGDVSKGTGSIDDIRQNYQNRVYAPVAKQDFMTSKLKHGLQQTTPHGEERVFDSEFDAINAGKKFTSTDITDNLSLYNKSMAEVNTAIKMVNKMVEGGIGQWVSFGKVPPGWKQVSDLRKGNQIFVAPEGIAKGLRTVSDPDYLSKVDSLKGLNKYQGLVKTVDLSLSAFHPLTFLKQALDSGNIYGLTHLFKMLSYFDDPENLKSEQFLTRHGLVTTKIKDNQDIVKKLTGTSDDLYSKISKIPGVKNYLQFIEKMTGFLFDKMQRYLKVTDAATKTTGWLKSHPNATPEETTKALYGITKYVNQTYGGLNWEALGISKTTQSFLRGVALAPDWLVANATNIKSAVSEGGTSGFYARRTLFVSLLSGLLLTEALNKTLTGHFTNKNPAGHELEVNIAPNTYVSLFRGPAGEALKMGKDIGTFGPAQGSAKYLQSKLAPFARVGLGTLSGVNYSGQNIYTPPQKKSASLLSSFRSAKTNSPTPLSRTLGWGKFGLEEGGPIPFGLSNLVQALQDKNSNLLGNIAVGTGIATHSPSPAKKTSTGFMSSFK